MHRCLAFLLSTAQNRLLLLMLHNLDNCAGFSRGLTVPAYMLRAYPLPFRTLLPSVAMSYMLCYRPLDADFQLVIFQIE